MKLVFTCCGDSYVGILGGDTVILPIVPLNHIKHVPWDINSITKNLIHLY